MGEGEDPRCEVDRHAPYVITDELDLASMNGRPDLKAQTHDGCPDRLGAADGPGWGVELGEEPITRGGYLDPSELVENAANVLVVGREKVLPPFVSEPGGDIGRGDDVGEQDGGEDTRP